jgi:putative phosphonate metabolism protein
MQGFKRYAIYYAPESAVFADFGKRWLGWDPLAGCDVPHPPYELPMDEITRTPRKYGFHGTIKPPFRLARGVDIGALHAAATALMAGMSPVRVEALKLKRIGGFLALVPEGDTTELKSMAGKVVKALDAFRAPMTDADIARRNPARLSDHQLDLLHRWGYPYVMDEFRFHLTLTSRVSPELAERTREVLDITLPDILPRPLKIRSLCLFGEADDGNFHMLHRYPFGG